MRAEKDNDSKAGFTLVELIVVVGITALLASILIVFSSRSQTLLLLGVEQIKLSQVILRAKTLAISSRSDVPSGTSFDTFCGYGVHFKYSAPQSYEIFQYNEVDKKTCGTTIQDPSDPVNKNLATKRYNPVGTANILPSNLVLRGVVQDIFFVPPNLMTNVWVTSGGGITSSIGRITIAEKAGTQTLTVTVTGVGQITP